MIRADSISSFIQATVIRSVSLLVPRAVRQEWSSEWLAELWYVRANAPSVSAVWLFCAGSMSDAWFILLRTTATNRRAHLQAPGVCLLQLFAALTTAFLIAVAVPGSRALLLRASHTDLRPFLGPLHLQVTGFPPNLIDQQLVMFRITILASWLVLIAVKTSFHFDLQLEAKDLRSFFRRSRWVAFFVAKMLLIVPLVSLSAITVGQTVEAALAEMAVCIVGFSVLFQWAVRDQHLRCPECLSRLEQPIQVGEPARLLLDSKVTEYLCPRDHGFLQFSNEFVTDTSHYRWIGVNFVSTEHRETCLHE